MVQTLLLAKSDLLEQLLRLLRGHLLPLGLAGERRLGHAKNLHELLVVEVLLSA